jgi:putative ABC transport system permease protein
MTLYGVAARNILRNKLRGFITVVVVAAAVFTFILFRTVIYAWTGAQDWAQKDRLVTRNKITFVMPLPKRYYDEVLRADGVKNATFASWFGGKDPNHEQEFFATLAIEGERYFDVIAEMSIPPDQLAAFKQDKQGAIVGDVLAAKLGWTVGQKITLESGIYPPAPDQQWTFNIVGIYTATAKSIDRSTFLFHWEYMNDALPDSRKDQIGWVMTRVTEPTRTANIGASIDKVFDEQEVQTMTQDEGAFQASFLAGFSAVLTALDIACVGMLAIMMLILGNTIAMGVRERTNEYGVLRAIGFLPRHLVIFILGEATIIGAIGGALGAGASYPLIERVMGRWIEENLGNFFPYFRVPLGAALAGVGLAVALGAIAGALPAIGASRLKVTDALRRVA